MLRKIRLYLLISGLYIMHPVVSGTMRYGLKPIAVESKAHLITIPCIGTNTYAGDTSSTAIYLIVMKLHSKQ